MRFIPVLIIIVVMAFLPSVLYARHILKTKRGVTDGVVAAYAIPTILILAFIFLQYATRAGILDVKVMQWTLWGFIFAILPPNVYALFYIIDKIIKPFTKKSCRTLHYIGTILALIVTIGLIIGMATRHCIQVREITIYSKNLPEEFDGIRIAHITDLHFGNLSPRDSYLKKIVTKLNEIAPDMLVCTGDMMNLTADEVNGLDGLFTSINTPLGRYAVMGNHDYGDYSKWESDEAKQANLMAAYEAYRRVGFVLLNDSAVQITDNKGQSIDNTTHSTLNSQLLALLVLKTGASHHFRVMEIWLKLQIILNLHNSISYYLMTQVIGEKR